jgi:hypothetical protein
MQSKKENKKLMRHEKVNNFRKYLSGKRKRKRPIKVFDGAKQGTVPISTETATLTAKYTTGCQLNSVADPDYYDADPDLAVLDFL